MLLGVGIPVGLLFVVFLPPWLGYDERTHFERAYDMAGGNFTPRDTVDGVGSWVPRSLQDDIRTWHEAHNVGESPWSPRVLSTMLANRPDGDLVILGDTQPTNASTPIGYLPAAVAVAPARALDAPMLAALWTGRAANLLAYLAVGALAVHLARAFRWTLVLTLLFPLNLQQGATVTPDGLTIAGLVLVLAAWTWYRAGPGRRADADLGWAPGEHGAPGTERRARVPVASVVAIVGGASLLLAVAKPPYFLAAAVFASVLVTRRPRRTDWAAAGAAAGGALVGVVWVLANSTRYQAVTETFERTLVPQPGVQRDRLLSDPLGFLAAVGRTFVGDFPHYVQDWSRHLGGFALRGPTATAWVVLVAFVAAAAWLDRRDLVRLSGRERAVVGATAVGLATLLYVSAWMYFEDRPSFAHLQLQGRYLLPLFPLAIMAAVPRGPLARTLVSALPARAAPALDRALPWVIVAVGAAIGVAAVATWVGPR